MAIDPPLSSFFSLGSDVEQGQFQAWAQALEAAINGNLTPEGVAALYASMVPQVTENEKALGQETALRTWSPVDVTDVVASLAAGGSEPQGRLSILSGNSVPAADVTAATDVYYTPHLGQRVPLYDGSRWLMRDIGGELSQALADTALSPAAAVANSNYDMFVWHDGSSFQCSRGPAWTSATVRGTGAGTSEIVRLDGVWANAHDIANGPLAHRGLYVGTIRTNAAAQVDDTLTLRHVFNAYNRVRRPFYLPIATSSWNYNAAAWRPVQGSLVYRVSQVRGLNEDAIDLQYSGNVNSTIAQQLSIAIGVDSTNTPSGTFPTVQLNVGNVVAQMSGRYCGLPGIGWHEFIMLEYGGDATVTFGGSRGHAGCQAGLTGQCVA